MVIALVESHGRGGIEARAWTGLERLPLRPVVYRDTSYEELDVDALIKRRPQVALVDELAHTNVPGSRHEKRWQDVEELLAFGVDVITNLNAGHLDSLNDAVESLTGVAQHETVPDQFVASAERVEMVNTTPEMLQARLSEGELFDTGDTAAALRGYYRPEKVSALRELALGWLSAHGLDTRGGAPDLARVVAALTGAPEGRHVVRRAAQIAATTGGELVGLHVREPSGLVQSQPAWLDEQQRLLAELGGRYAEVAGVNVARAVLDFCRSENAGHLVLGASRRTRSDELLHGSVIERAIHGAGPVEIHVIPTQQAPKGLPSSVAWPLTGHGRVPLPRRRRQLAWGLAVVAPLVLTLALIPWRSSVGIAGALFAALLGVVAVAAIGGIGPAALAIVVGFLTADLFFTRPYYSLRVDHIIDVIALVSFAIIGGVVGVLVDVLSRQGVEAAGSRSEAEGLARLAAESLSTTPDSLAPLADTLRNAFDLGSVSVLQRAGDGWSPEFCRRRAGAAPTRRDAVHGGTVRWSRPRFHDPCRDRPGSPAAPRLHRGASSPSRAGPARPVGGNDAGRTPSRRTGLP